MLRITLLMLMILTACQSTIDTAPRTLPDYVTPVFGTPPTNAVFVTATVAAQETKQALNVAPTPSQEIWTPLPLVGRVATAAGLNVRACANLRCPIISRLDLGATVPVRDVTQIDNGFLWRQLANGGWVAEAVVNSDRIYLAVD